MGASASFRRLLGVAVLTGAAVITASSSSAAAGRSGAVQPSAVSWSRGQVVSIDGNGKIISAQITDVGNAVGGGGGRVIAFSAGKPSQVFVRDRVTNRTTRVSVNAAWITGNGPSWGASISADGRYVAFVSAASNLVTGDTNGKTDVFVRDLWSYTTRRVDTSASGAQANGNAENAAISGDGRMVLFTTTATNIVVPDRNGSQFDVIAKRLADGQTTRVSQTAKGVQLFAILRDVSFDAHYVLLDGRVKDRWTGAVTTVDSWKNGDGMDIGNANELSGDGRWIGMYLAIHSDGFWGPIAFDWRTKADDWLARMPNGSVAGNSSQFWGPVELSGDARYAALYLHYDFGEVAPLARGVYVRDRNTQQMWPIVTTASADGDLVDALELSSDGKALVYHDTASGRLYVSLRTG